MSTEKIDIIIGLLIAVEVFQTILIARLIQNNKKQEKVIRTEKIEMDGFELKIENKELTIKQKQ